LILEVKYFLTLLDAVRKLISHVLNTQKIAGPTACLSFSPVVLQFPALLEGGPPLEFSSLWVCKQKSPNDAAWEMLNLRLSRPPLLTAILLWR